MPLYAFKCPKCKHSFEWLQRTHTEPKPWCPECGEPDTKRLFYTERPPLPIFTVKGFYVTDYKGKNSNA